MSGADPYAPLPPPFWEKFPRATPAVVVGLLTAVCTVLMFPPFHAAELGYLFAAPAIFWAYRRPRLKLFVWTMFISQSVAWLAILVWLRHVTWIGWLLLGPLVGAWVGVWYLAVWWAMPRVAGRATPVRLMGQLGLAGLWVVVEWTRDWLITGFPWLPLAASQWERTSVLQIAAYTGAWGVSFVLIVMNIGAAAYAHRLFFEPGTGLAKRSQEFMMALFLLLACLCSLLTETFNRGYYMKSIGRMSFIQPDIPQSEKWEPGEETRILGTLQNLTKQASYLSPDLILWPESAFPLFPANAPEARQVIDALVKDAGSPILFGAVTEEVIPGKAGQPAKTPWFDAACYATPAGGMRPDYYAKRHLVPFGEYVPWPWLFGWLSKVVPIPNDGKPGTDAAPMLLDLKSGALAVGPLICYEDVFPELARQSVSAGADVLVVLTNDAWYGEEGAAYQHAAHSVLRAVETRRPVLRCGNDGWSGWIDEYGSYGNESADSGHHPNVLMKNGSIYGQGVWTMNILRDSRWAGRETFYVRHGDWFVLASALLSIFGYFLLLSPARARGPDLIPQVGGD